MTSGEENQANELFAIPAVNHDVPPNTNVAAK